MIKDPMTGSPARVTDGKLSVTPIFEDDDGNEIDMASFVKDVRERLLILDASFKKHDKYPALKDAYDQYKLIEKLIQDDAKKS